MARKRKWTDEKLIDAVKNETSIYGVLRKLDLKLCGGSHATVKLRIRQLELDTSHFTGSGWCRGKKHEEYTRRFIQIPLEKILIKESTYQSTHNLKNRLLRERLLKHKCYLCNCGPIWENKFLSLQLDHIDGDRCNNLLTNLRLLCPNCHSQTSTFCKRESARKPR